MNIAKSITVSMLLLWSNHTLAFSPEFLEVGKTYEFLFTDSNFGESVEVEEVDVDADKSKVK